MPRNLPEADRKKNQFDKEERVHLLAIMKRYGPLLDNSTSTLARKKIWTSIEDEFKNAGFTRKTSAQLKKYWQNYKYHCKKSRALGKEKKKCVDFETDDTPEWNRYQIFVDDRSATKFPEMSGIYASYPDPLQRTRIEPGYRSTGTYENDGGSSRKSDAAENFIDLSRVKTERDDEESMSNDHERREANPLKDACSDEELFEEKDEILLKQDEIESPTSRKMRNRIVVSNANISNNSVTVSVIYPENKSAVPGRMSAEGSRIDRREEHDREASMKIQEYAAAAKNDLYAIPSEFRDSMSHNDRPNLDEKDENARNEKRGTPDRRTDHSSVEKEAREYLKEDGTSGPAEGQEGDSTARTKSFETRNDPPGSRGYVFLTDYRNQLKHRLLLQQLETEEKRLKVKIAEMAIQEVQLRIKALNEDMRRTEELHRLRLANAFTGSGHFDELENRRQT